MGTIKKKQHLACHSPNEYGKEVILFLSDKYIIWDIILIMRSMLLAHIAVGSTQQLVRIG